MIKSNEWTKAICGATNFPLNPDGLNVIVEQIQRDAWKQGVTDAAGIAEDAAEDVQDNSGCIVARRAIMDKIKSMAAMSNK